MQLIIYFDEKPVYLCDQLTAEIEDRLHHPDTVFIDELSTAAINSLLHEIKKTDFHAGVILHPDINKLKKDFFHHFTAIEAAGGIVQNAEKQLLFIYRLGKWDLPKGKMEAGESTEEAAKREIEEETGIKNLENRKKVGETYHTYNAYGKHYIKTTHWFYFFAAESQKLVPQLEEDITSIKWFSTKEIKTPMESTYASIRQIVRCFFDTP